uniref:anthranilate synthase component I family protein n=1 Tax=Paenibacillus durus TaxID=44251 RepID=UPI00047092B2
PATVSAAASAAELKALYEETLEKAEEMLEKWRQICEAAEAAEEAEPDTSSVPDIPAATESGEWPGMFSAFTREKFQQAVLDIQEYIRQGDVFQVNLSLRQEAPLTSSPEEVYEWLRRLNPSPYMGLLRSPGFALSSASPELLVKLHGDKVSARPIAGTRRRGLTPAEDAAMEAELRGSAKETAEHIMLVDLERNDIGRVSAYGTVNVPELMTVERYSHVMHLVSQVNGRIAEGKDAYDVIAALFPGGTITGAPKVRTMEIIEELEPVRRGPYTGSMGWIDYGGNMELNIIIRTLVVKDGIGYIQTGAGIVIDSDPYREYRECHNKAKAIVKAVLCSEAIRESQPGGGAEGAK